jgi:hypothetical protein
VRVYHAYLTISPLNGSANWSDFAPIRGNSIDMEFTAILSLKYGYGYDSTRSLVKLWELPFRLVKNECIQVGSRVIGCGCRDIRRG